MDGTNPVSDGNSAPAPATFADAFAADASSASGTPDQSSTPAAAEALPTATGDTPAAEDPRSPFIPRDRFDDVNTKYGELKKWKEQFAWAEQVDRGLIETATKHGQKWQQNKVALIAELLEEAKQDPAAYQELLSMQARALSMSRQNAAQQKATGPDLSQIVVDLGNGQSLPISDLAARIKADAMAEFEQKFGPVAKTVADIREEKAQAERARAINDFNTSAMDRITKWPGMDSKENQAVLGKALAEAPINGDDPNAILLAAYDAYMTRILPTQSASAQSALLDNLKQKANASTSVNPGSAAASAPGDIRGFHDSRLTW